MNPNPDKAQQDIEAIQADATAQRDIRSLPIMVEILQFIVSLPDLAEFSGATKTEAEKDAYWREKTALFFPRLRERGLLNSDIGYAFRLALASIEGLKDIVEATISEKEDYVITKFLGIDNINMIPLDVLEAKELPYRAEDYEEYRKKAESVDNGDSAIENKGE